MHNGDDAYEKLRGRTKSYASRMITLYAYLQAHHHFNDAALVIGKQLLRSGTSVAANHREAKYSRSVADRIAKFSIVLQELEESGLWVELLIEHNMADAVALHDLLNETDQLTGIFAASIKRLRTRHEATG